MPKGEIKPIFVRLTGAERRRIKTLAASQGLTMREAIVHAFEVWAAQLRSAAKGSSSPRAGSEASRRPSVGGRPKKHNQPESALLSEQVRRLAEVRPSEEGPSLADVPGLQALVGDWVAKAMQLDWSKCPAAESVQTKKGTVWVGAGTLTPLIHIFEAVAGDNPLPEIVEVYMLTMP